MIIRKRDAECIDFDGLGILDYTARLDGNAASMAAIDIPPGTSHAESWSKRSDKYYLVTSGSIRFVLDNDRFDLDSGDFCLVKQGRKFSYRNVQAEPARLVLVHTPPFDLGSEVFTR
ncbi:MAG: cupin domain-containing protein [Lysobacterales bacterium]|jgi:mannose-6-phosphate isomerase-like protein (cupin superfamily)